MKLILFFVSAAGSSVEKILLNHRFKETPAAGSNQQRKQRDDHGAAEHYRPVTQIETEKSALGHRDCKLGHLSPPVLSLPRHR